MTPEQLAALCKDEPAEPANMDKLGSVGKLATAALELEFEIERDSILLAEKQEKLRKLQEIQIPELMTEIGLAKVTLDNGFLISIKKSHYANISKSREQEAFEWLEANGFGSLVKNKIELNFAKGEGEAIGVVTELLTSAGFSFVRKESVHPSTLKSFVNERVKSGEPFPQELFGVHAVSKAEIKKK